MNSYNSPTTKPLYRSTQIVWYVLSLIEVLLIIRFFLKSFGASSTAGFSNFIYSVTSFFTAPFTTVFQASYVDGNSFEWTTLLAIGVYWMLAIGITRILVMSKTVSTPEAAVKLTRLE